MRRLIHCSGYGLGTMVFDYGGDCRSIRACDVEMYATATALADLPDILSQTSEDIDFDWPAELVEWIERQDWPRGVDISEWPGSWEVDLQFIHGDPRNGFEALTSLYWRDED